jgi:Protein of unknown function (DUF5132)
MSERGRHGHSLSGHGVLPWCVNAGNRDFQMDAIHNGRGDAHANGAVEEPGDQENGGINKTVATVVVVAAGAALFEAALLPGLVLGVAAMAAPKYLPRLAGALGPVFKSTVRGTFKLAQKSKEAFAEAQEHVNDIVAEVRAEDADGASGVRTANKPRTAA